MQKGAIQKRIARATGNYSDLNKKAMAMRNSWNEVQKLLESGNKGKNNSKKS